MKIVLIVLGVFYGLIMVLTGGMMFTQKRLGRLASALMLIGGSIITITFIDKEMASLVRTSLLGLGLIAVHISAIMNGYKLYGKPLVKHHLIRACISVILFFGNCWVY